MSAARTSTFVTKAEAGLKQVFSIAVGSVAMLVGENAAHAAQSTGILIEQAKTAAKFGLPTT